MQDSVPHPPAGLSVQVRKWKPPLSSTMDKGHPHTFNGKQEAEGNQGGDPTGVKRKKDMLGINTTPVPTVLAQTSGLTYRQGYRHLQ